MNIINRTNTDTSILFDILDIILIHSGIMKNDKITFNYINRESEADIDCINVIKAEMDSNLIEYEKNYFVINKYRIREQNYFSIGNKFFLNFDIFMIINTIIFDDLDFLENEIFNYAFTEHLIDVCSKAVEKFALLKSISINIAAKQIGSTNGYFVPTFDIDRLNFFSFKKTVLYCFFRMTGLYREKTALYFHMLKTNEMDPWNNIRTIRQILEDDGLEGIFNFLTIERDKYARRYSKKQLKRALSDIGSNIAGIHLSAESFEDKTLIEKEINKLRKLSKNIVISRFHYLNDPKREDFKILSDAGILIDLSSGFTHRCGFKRGFSSPYRVPGTQITELPLICMDSALMKNNDMHKNINTIIDEIKSNKGFFSFLFHPSCMNEDTFPGYRELFHLLLNMRKTNNFYFDNIFNMIENYNNRIEAKNGKYEYHKQ